MAIEDEVGFSRAVLEEAQLEADDIINLAKREAERILDGVRAELEQLYIAESPEAKRQKARTRYNQIIAGAELEARQKILRVQERNIQEVQARVKQALAHLRDTSGYTELLYTLIRRGVAELDGEQFEVIVAPEDCEQLTDALLSRLCQDTGKTVMRSAESQAGIVGAIVQRTDKRVMCNNSFQAILQRQEHEVRLIIAQELFGDIVFGDSDSIT